MCAMTAVIPAAGLGTRLFPLSYAIPKELLPLGPKPAIQLVVEELRAAGLQEFVIIIGKNKGAIADHFAMLQQQEAAFAADRLRVRCIEQEAPRGLGDAVLCAAEYVTGDFCVALGDAVIWGKRFGDLVRRMLTVREATGAAVVVAAQEVALPDTSRYGILQPGEVEPGGAVRVLDLVEKPGPERAPSRLAICARYVLSQDVFAVLRELESGYGGEVQLTDALRALAREQLAYAVPLQPDEERWDVGSLEGYGRASVKAWQAQQA